MIQVNSRTRSSSPPKPTSTNAIQDRMQDARSAS